MPAAITQIKVDYKDNLHFGCMNRLLTFKLKPLFKEQDLPNYWQNTEIRKMIDRMPQQHQEAEEGRTTSPGIVLSELRKLIAHGVLLPDSVRDIATQYPTIDIKQLFQNLKKFQVTAQQVLKLLANARFAPKDVLTALATKTSPQILYSLVNQGASINAYMQKMGFKMLASGEDPVVNVDIKSLVHPSSMIQHKGLGADFDYVKWWQKYFPYRFEDDEDEDEDEDTFPQAIGRQYVQPKGKIVHFIPSEQMKLLKDLKSKRDIKPVFLRSLVSGQVDEEVYPNFTGQEDYEEILVRSKRPYPVKSERFNETLKGTLIRTTQRKPLRSQIKVEEGTALERNPLHASSQIFRPNQYFQTRGLNISFDTQPQQQPKKSLQMSATEFEAFTETLLSTPIVIGQAKNERYSLPVADKSRFKERLFKMPDISE